MSGTTQPPPPPNTHTHPRAITDPSRNSSLTLFFLLLVKHDKDVPASESGIKYRAVIKYSANTQIVGCLIF